MKRLMVGMAALLMAGTALAARPGDLQKQVEASMLVTGTIGITPEGTVLGYTLDQPERLPPVVSDVVLKNVPRWTFKPVLKDGKPVAAKTKMSLRLVAHPAGNGNVTVGIKSAYFGDDSADMRTVHSVMPRYPRQALHDRVGGTVYVLLRIDRTGKVVDAIAQQVDLQELAGEDLLKHWRDLLAGASLDAVRQWTFTPAAPGETAAYRYARMPVSYAVGPSRPAAYGTWESYLPGPLEPQPWSDNDVMLSGGADALPGDGVYGKQSLSLLTPLDKS